MLFSSKAFSKDDTSRVVSSQGEYDVKHDVVLRVCRKKQTNRKEIKKRIRGACDMVGFGVGRNGGGRFSAV